MRYLINDDDYEDWIKRLKQVKEALSKDEYQIHGTLEYVISEMEIELEQHTRKKTSQPQ